MVKEEFKYKGHCHDLPLEEQYDPVERPSHYVQGPMEVIDIIEKYGFCDDFRLGNCVKYLFRHNLKGAALQDLKKARWYLDRYINAIEKDLDDLVNNRKTKG